MNPSTVAFHTILLTADRDAIVENHAHYCAVQGYSHTVHAIGSPANSERCLLLYKYSLVRKTLSETAIGDVVIFADDAAAIYIPLPAHLLPSDGAYWIAQCAGNDRPDGCFFVMRSGSFALQLLDGVLDRLRCIDDRTASRWRHIELEGIAAQAPDQLINGHRPIMLFVSIGHHLPELSAFVLSLNPEAHDNAQDARLTEAFVRHLNGVNKAGGRVLDIPNPEAGMPFEVVNPGMPTALITSYTPNITRYAAVSERNITSYCMRHGYTHYIYRDLAADVPPDTSGNWLKTSLLLRHLGAHETVGWVDADILIHGLHQPLEAITHGNPFTLARDISGHHFNSGFMVFANTPQCRAYLERVQALIVAVTDKTAVYASGGDQALFIKAWEELGGTAAIPLSDCVSFNSHPAVYDADTFMLHYMGMPDRLRAIVMRNDEALIARRTAVAEAPMRPPSPFITASCRHGLFTVFRSDTHVGRSLQVYGEWSEPEIALFAQIIRKGDTVVEAGANVGSHTVWLSHRVGDAGRVIALEPARHTFHLLCANLVANACTNVRALQHAVGAASGELDFPLLDPHMDFNFGGTSLKAGWTGATDRVPCTALDDLALERLDFIKADVEGFELELLAGSVDSIVRFRPVVYVEINGTEIRNGAVAKMEALGYSCWYYISPLFTKDNWNGHPDDIFDGNSFDMVCLPEEKFEVTGLLRAGVNDQIVSYPPGQIHWIPVDWRQAVITRRLSQ